MPTRAKAAWAAEARSQELCPRRASRQRKLDLGAEPGLLGRVTCTTQATGHPQHPGTCSPTAPSAHPQHPGTCLPQHPVLTPGALNESFLHRFCQIHSKFGAHDEILNFYFRLFVPNVEKYNSFFRCCPSQFQDTLNGISNFNFR